MPQERHAVYANTDHGSFRVGQPVDWGTAIDRWYRLDNRRTGLGGPGGVKGTGVQRTLKVRHDGRQFKVNSFEVRAVDAFGRGLGSERHTLAFPVPYRLCRVTK